MVRAKLLHVVVRWGDSVLLAREVASETDALRDALGPSCADLASRLSVHDGRVLLDGARELGASVREEVGDYSLEATPALDEARSNLTEKKVDRLSLGGAFISILVHGLLIAAVATDRSALEPPTAATPADIREQLEAIEAARAELSIPPPPPDGDGPGNTGGEPGSMAKKTEGAMGTHTAPNTRAQYGISGSKKPRSGEGRSLGIDAQTFGMIGLLTTSSAFHDDSSAGWGPRRGGPDVRFANGNMWGGDIADAFGDGGLGLSGVGEGGGGRGRGVGLIPDDLDVFGHGAGEGGGGAGDRLGLGSIGTIGHGSWCGGDGCGEADTNGNGRVSGSHRSKAPRVIADGASVAGHVPPEAIQRVVRQNFGRFRLCYENELRAQPSLSGRVAVRFVIGRDGSVASVSAADSSLPASVASCVANAFAGLSFPAPEGGVVTVTYPINFSPE